MLTVIFPQWGLFVVVTVVAVTVAIFADRLPEEDIVDTYHDESGQEIVVFTDGKLTREEHAREKIALPMVVFLVVWVIGMIGTALCTST